MTHVTGLLSSSSPIQLQNFAKIGRIFPAVSQLQSNPDTANYATTQTTACNSEDWYTVELLGFMCLVSCAAISFSSVMPLASCWVHSTRSDQHYYISESTVISLDWAPNNIFYHYLLFSEMTALLIDVCRLVCVYSTKKEWKCFLNLEVEYAEHKGKLLIQLNLQDTLKKGSYFFSWDIQDLPGAFLVILHCRVPAWPVGLDSIITRGPFHPLWFYDSVVPV